MKGSEKHTLAGAHVHKEDAFVHVRAGSIYLYISTKGRYRYRIASKLMIGEIPARKLSSSSHKFG